MSDPAALIAQHARTTKLMGVDFIPLGHPSAHTIAAPESNHEEAVLEAPIQHHKVVEFKASPSADTQVGPSAPLEDIRGVHAGADDPQAKLDALRAKYESDAPHNAYAQDFNHIVFGEGSPSADLMFIGEAPGEQEDQTGRPFVGRAGQLLEKMIVAMGFARDTVYICNVLKVRPPNNATPTPEQARASAPYLAEQIRIVNPSVIVTLGRPATNLLLGNDLAMRDLRGQWHPFPPHDGAALGGLDLPQIQVMPTYHPAYLLRAYTEENRRKVWSDLQQVVAALKDNAS